MAIIGKKDIIIILIMEAFMEIIIIMELRNKVIIVRLIFMEKEILIQIIKKSVFLQKGIIFMEIIIIRILILFQITKINLKIQIRFIIHNNLNRLINNIHQITG